MEEQKEVMCPWCLTEIVWDEEFGPEESCPHCFNELGNYRSVQIGANDQDDDLLDEDDVIAPKEVLVDSDDIWDDEDLNHRDIYSETVQQCIDEQEEAPECLSCRELLLLTGQRNVISTEFTSHIPNVLDQAFLGAPFTMNVYICPSCFRIEHVLSDKDRSTMIERLSKEIVK